MNDIQWPQCYYKQNNEDKTFFSNSAQSFYNTENLTMNDCSQCYYQTDKKNGDEDYYPQCYYHHEDEK
jgi:hypothetical protein